MARTSPFKAHIRTIIRRAELLEKIHGRNVRIMRRVGAYGWGALKKLIRPPRSNRGATTLLRTQFGNAVRGRKVTIQTIDIHGNPRTLDCAVPVEGFGRVIDMKTGRPVSRSDAERARFELRGQTFKEGVGQPPRRGPTDKLRKFMDFDTVEERGEITSVIGTYVFRQQPRLVGARNVPLLLEHGGYEEISGQLVKYEPHPYIAVARESTVKKLAQLIRQTK